MIKSDNVIFAYARGLSQYYQDGTERMEIWISKKYERFFPNVYSEAIPIDVLIGGKRYCFFFRKTEKCPYLWLCPYVMKNTKKERLADILREYNISKNDKLMIRLEDDMYELKK